MAGTPRAKTREQKPATTQGTALDGIRRKVFLDRYALKGEDGTPLEEYPEQMWRRVAAGIAAVEPDEARRAEWTDRFYELLRDFKFVPGGRILSGAGTGHEVTYYNCYVVGLGEDPLDPNAPKKPMLGPAEARPAFFSALAQMTDIMSRSGGVGMNLSALPPKGTPIRAEGRGTNGAVRPTVALSLTHPDVGRLLDEKDGPNLAHVDVAVIVPPEFDAALAADADWTPRWNDTQGETLRARDLWARVTESAGRPVTILRPDAPMLAIEDSRDAIVGGAADVAMMLYRGEAPVADFSRLRPKGAYIKTVNGTSSGPVAWMYLYDAVARCDDGAAPAEKGVIWFGEIASVITGKTIQQGGCFGPDQRIATSRGLLRAADLADLIDTGATVDALTHRGPRPITWSFRNGTKPLFRVTTARGFTVDVTAEHKMGVLRAGKLATVPLAELEAGDEVLLFLGVNVAGDYVGLESPAYRRSLMSTRLNEDVQLPDVLDERLAYLLGYMHGDGYVHWGKKVAWHAPKAIKLATADAYPEIREQLIGYARDLFGIEPVVEDRAGEGCTTVALYSRVIVDWLQHNDLLKAHSDAVRVPDAIFRSPSSVMAAFVAGYFDADGSDRGKKGGYGFDSVSLAMLRDIQQLLAANGILSHIHTTDRTAQGWRTMYRLVVTGAEFKARMNLFIRMARKNRAREGFRNHRNGYPRDVWPELGVPGRYYQGLWDSTKPHISYRALSRVQDRLVLKGEVALAERIEQLLHTVPDHIVSIEPLGLSEVYDFEVADVHMLSGNGIYTSNSRRGALMLMLDDDHPDIEEFIAAKRIDPTTMRPVMIEHANMSLCISDAFMEAVKADLPWDLKWQGRVVRTVRARDVWDKICAAAWLTAEPGVVFMQRAQEHSNTWYWENIRCVNPCVTGDTLIYTAAGLYPAAELAEIGAPVTVASPGDDGVSFRKASHVFATGVKPVYRLQTTEGYAVRLTAEHKVLTTSGWKEARQLTRGDRIRLLNGEGGFGATGTADMGRVLGWLVGDGCINTNKGKGQPSIVLSFWGRDRALAPAFAEMVNRLVAAPEGARQYHLGVMDITERNESRVCSVRLVRLIDPELMHHKLQVPPSVLHGSREMQRGFLQALFSADGSVQGTQVKGVSVRLSSSDRGLLEGVQRLLLNFGIASSIYANRRQEMARPMPDGKGGHKDYVSKAQHELVVARANLPVFAEKIGFLQVEKQGKLAGLLGAYKRAFNREEFVATFESLTADGEERVYDLTEPEKHLFIGSGMALHNCGEQPLPPGGVCNLGALNLACYVDAEGKLLEEELARDAAYATRFLDDVIDATPYFSALHVTMQREATRRTGLGTMGLADALIKMRVAYGSAESLEVIERIYRIIRDAAYRASVELAREKGPCGGWQKGPDKYAEGWFIKRLPQAVQEGIREHGIRNGVILTQAPTGCLVPGTMVLTERGYLPIEALGNPGGERWQDITVRVASEGGVREADAFFVNGEAPTTRVVTRRGYEIQGTHHHRIRVWQNGAMEWVPLEQIKPGMTVPIYAPALVGTPQVITLAQPDRRALRGVPVSLPEILSPQLAYLVGYFMGDGSLKERTLRFASSGTRDREQVQEYLRETFGREPIVYPDPRSTHLTSIELHGQDVVAFWTLNGFAKRPPREGHAGKGYCPHVPFRILASNDPAIYGAFLAGLFDADASLDREYVISWNTTEKRFHDHVKALLLSLGIFTHTYRVTSGWGKVQLYRLRPCHAHASMLLNRALPMLARIVPHDAAARRQTLGDTIPLSQGQGRQLAHIGHTRRDKQFAYAATHLGYMTRERMVHFITAYRDDMHEQGESLLVDAIDEPIFFDKVVSVEDGGVHPTFDLSVPGTHAYVANGFISHNTTSLLAGVSSGIEPVYDFAMKRTDRLGEHIMYHPLLQEWMDEHPGEERPAYFVGAKDLTPEEHVVVQAKVQEYTDSSISKTSNAPNDHTIDDVKRLYTLAYDLGCKGVTYYRDGSRDAVLTSVTEAPAAAAETAGAEQSADDGAVAPASVPVPAAAGAAAAGAAAVAASPSPAAAGAAAAAPTPPVSVAPTMPAWMLEGRLKRRPSEMGGFTRNVSAPEGKVNITINSDEDGPLEVFINIGRAGSDVAALAEALGRLISLQLRLPSTMSQEERLRQVANQLRGIGGSRSIGFGKNRVQSLPDAVAQAIFQHLEEHPVAPARAPSVPATQLALPVSDPWPSSPASHPLPTSSSPAPGATAPAEASAAAPSVTATVAPAASGYPNGHGVAAEPQGMAKLTGNLCPQCGSSGSYVYEEGCRKCHNCGYSEC